MIIHRLNFCCKLKREAIVENVITFSISFSAHCEQWTIEMCRDLKKDISLITGAACKYLYLRLK